MNTTLIMQAPVERESSEFSKSRAGKPAARQEPLSVDSVCAIFDVSPESTQVDRLVDETCYGILTDKKLECFAEFFKEVIKENIEIFNSKTNQEKANILYKFHLDEIIYQLRGCDTLNKIANSFFKKINASLEKTAEEVVLKRALRSRIDYLHSDYARLAIATALGASVKEISVSYGDSQDTPALKKPSDMEIYKQ